MWRQSRSANYDIKELCFLGYFILSQKIFLLLRVDFADVCTVVLILWWAGKTQGQQNKAWVDLKGK